MLDPFVDTKQVINGKSFGLSSCSYAPIRLMQTATHIQRGAVRSMRRRQCAKSRD